MTTITSKEKISMFLIEYYFGFSKWITPLRLVGGPFFILLGFTVLIKNPVNNSPLFALISFLIGAFTLLRPYFSIILKMDSYKTQEIKINVYNEKISIVEENIKTDIIFGKCKEIKERKKYFVFIFTKIHRVQIPKHVFSKDEFRIIKNKITK